MGAGALADVRLWAGARGPAYFFAVEVEIGTTLKYLAGANWCLSRWG